MIQHTYLKNVSTLALDEQRCTGCVKCVEVCPHAVFEMHDKKAYITDKDKCMECGACAINCKSQAITVSSGVGCAAGIINGLLRNSEPTCGCGEGGCC